MRLNEVKLVQCLAPKGAYIIFISILHFRQYLGMPQKCATILNKFDSEIFGRGLPGFVAVIGSSAGFVAVIGSGFSGLEILNPTTRPKHFR